MKKNFIRILIVKNFSYKYDRGVIILTLCLTLSKNLVL